MTTLPISCQRNITCQNDQEAASGGLRVQVADEVVEIVYDRSIRKASLGEACGGEVSDPGDGDNHRFEEAG